MHEDLPRSAIYPYTDVEFGTTNFPAEQGDRSESVLIQVPFAETRPRQSRNGELSAYSHLSL